MYPGEPDVEGFRELGMDDIRAQITESQSVIAST
jgi:hypothetical protein